MKENLTNKEIELKEAAQGLSFDLDTDDIWSNIEPQLPPNEGRKRFPIWWMRTGIVTGVLLLSIILFYNQYDQKLDVTNDKEIQSPQTIQSSNPIANKSGSNNNDTATLAKNESSLRTKTSTLNQTLQSSFDDLTNLDLMDNSNIYGAPKVSNDITFISQPITFENLTPPSKNENTTLQLIDETIEDPTVRSTERVRNDEYNVTSIKQLDLSLLHKEGDLTLSLPAAIKPLHSSPWHSYWQINTGINQSLSKTKFQNNLEINPSIYEQNLIGISNALEYGKENLKGWRWFTGVSYNRLSTRYSNSDRIVQPGTELGEVSKTIDEDGNEMITIGDVNVTSIIEYDIIWHRNHDYINLHLGAGKRIMLTSRLSVIADVNASYNIWSQHQGYYFDENNPTIVKFGTSEKHVYQNQGLNLGGRLSLAYDLGSFSVGLSSLYETSLKPTTSNNYFNIKNSHYGVQLGIVYRP